MTRTNPLMALPELARRADVPSAHVRSYRLIAPLFGGGVEPQQADPVSVVRSSEVRGQLRFWWRATRAGRYGPDGLKAMKEAEDLLWGSTEGQSRVEVEVRLVESGVVIGTYRNGRGGQVHVGDPASPISYGAFPLRNTEQQPGEQPRPPGVLRFGVSFDLLITLPRDDTLRQDVIAALWAWETFGGLGARTRRGFGALHCWKVQNAEEIGPWLPLYGEAQQVEAWLRDRLQEFVVPGIAPNGVPQLSRDWVPKVGRNQNVEVFAGNDARGFESRIRQLLTGGGYSKPSDELVRGLVAWYYPIEKLRAFRQQYRYRSQANNNAYGRSYWPEPDEIRWRTNVFRGRHSQPEPANRRRSNKFPRAVFGLPIIFQFKDGIGRPRSLEIDPPSTTLQGAKHDRLASPLILRPLACADGRIVSVATLLAAPTTPPGGLKLEGDPSGVPIDTADLTAVEANFRPLNGQTDVIRAFLATL